MKVESSVIVVTGASAGIGAALVQVLLERGAQVVLTARRETRLREVVQSADPANYLIVAGDIQDEAFCHHLIERTVEHFGRIDILVNNAGIGHASVVAEISAEHLQQVIGTNLYGLIYATQAAVPHMQNGGQIINVSSIVGQRPIPNGVIYCASKTAVNFVTRGLRMELRGTPITLTSVYPGTTVTEFNQVKLGGTTKRRRGVSAETVAHKIIRAIEKQQTEVYITRFDWLFTHLNRLFPRTLDRLFAIFMPAPTTEK